ncbi:hypothetical protein GO013_05250 [Pseudodesulfovibrio sp. JC047]|nr:hypothetical protein [Pseudodesulfovibrio sp. JC047]
MNAHAVVFVPRSGTLRIYGVFLRMSPFILDGSGVTRHF